MEQRVAGAGRDRLVLTEVQAEEGPEGGAGGRHQEPVAGHAAAVRTHEYQVSVTRILREERDSVIIY